MNKCAPAGLVPCPEHTIFCVTARRVDGNTNVIHHNLGATPASQCAAQAGKLFALSSLFYGAGFDAFDSSADEIKQNLTWLLSDLAKEVWVLAELAAKAEVSHG
jgi:hypothetical protein